MVVPDIFFLVIFVHYILFIFSSFFHATRKKRLMLQIQRAKIGERREVRIKDTGEREEGKDL